ncbi:MAG: glycerophosphodiester phosphodiesterase family protein [Chitinophagaceae bacterium]|nr:glycerophosphodiester phosphodiesterase family protein [Chitinophagaceae bacterium]
MMYKVRRFLLLIILVQTGFLSTAQRRVDSILNDFHHRPDRVLVAAHRAPHANQPENSLAAVKEAISMGIDIVELDLRETKDGVLVIMHDKTVDRTTTGKGAVSGMSWKQLKKLRLLHNGKPTGERIPTFKEVLKLVKGNIMLDIDYKAEGGRAARSTLKLLRKKGMERQSLFFLYDYKDADTLYAMNPKLQFMTRAYNKDDVDGILQLTMPVPVIHADDKFYTDSLMSVIRVKGKRLWMNALNKYDKMEQEKKGAGFDALLQLKHTNIIQTDLPKELLEYLRRRGLHR